MSASIFHAWRSWKSARGTGLLAIVALALGIGSTSAIYTVVQSVLLNPLPFANPDRYLAVRAGWRGLNLESGWSYPNCVDYAQRAKTLDAFGCTAYGNFSLVVGSQPVFVTGAQVSPALLRSMGVPLLAGGWFGTSPSDLHSAVISESLWRQTGADPAIVGKPLTVNALPYTVVGVAPAWFRFPLEWGNLDVWIPLDPTPAERVSRDNKYMAAYAKKKPGLSDGEVAADLKGIAAQLEREYPDSETKHIVSVTSLLSKAVEYVRPSLLILLAAAGALLAIACGNVASLLLTRSVARVRETALRVALGATAWQLAAQYVFEGVLLALGGAVLGLLLSLGLIRAVLLLAATRIPRSNQIRLDWHTLFFTAAVAVSCGILFSLAPLWQAWRTSPNQVLTSGLRSSASAGARKLLRIFVTGEIALSFALMALAGIFVQHLGALFRVDPGFNPENVIVFRLYVPPAKYSNDQTRVQYQTRLLSAIERLPGVLSAGFASDLPLLANFSDIFTIPDHRDLSHISLAEIVARYDYQFRSVSPGFFQAMQMTLKSGRNLLDDGKPGAKSEPILISETVARKLWPGESALGHVVNLGDSKVDCRVSGVVGDVKDSLNAPSPGHLYVPYQAYPTFTMWWAVRSELPLSSISREIQRAVAGIDPQQSLGTFYSMAHYVSASVNREQLQASVVSFFGASALLLAMLGVYGVISYSVRQRLPEMGTRFALGATGNQLTGLILMDTVKTTAIGTAIGLAIVLVCLRWLSTLGVRDVTWQPFVLSLVLIALCTLISSALPSLMAGRVAPAMAIGDLPDSIKARAKQGYRDFSRAISAVAAQTGGAGNAAEMSLLADIADSARYAASFNDAIQTALVIATRNLDSPGAALLVRRSAGEPFRFLSSAPQGSFSWTLPVNSLLVNRLARYYPALPVTAEDLQVLQRWTEEEASSRSEEVRTLQAIGPAVSVPVAVRDEIVGVLFVTPPAGKASFDARETRLIRSIGAQLALMIENSNLTDRIVEQERLKRDIALATEVQQRLFPEHPPEVKSARLAGFCLPARGVGGDYYDFLRLNDHEIGIALADVAGKGVAAALVMSVIQASLRSIAGTDGDSPVKLAAKVNRLLCASTGPSSYATFFYAKFDETERKLCYVNGGHNPPFLLRNSPEREIEELAAGGMIIGMFPQATFEETQVRLNAGDVLMAFTDGVSEAHNPYEEEFGDSRIKDLLRKYADLPIHQMSTTIVGDLKAWMADAPQHDDLTFILMKVE